MLVADFIWIVKIADSALAQMFYNDTYWTGMMCACHISVSNNYITLIILYYVKLVSEKHVVM